MVFAEFYRGTHFQDRAFEIGNVSDQAIDLTGYSVVIYKSGSLSSPYEIKLQGTIEAKGAYVVAYSEASEEIKAKADQLDGEFPNIGSYPMVLTDGEFCCDVLGTVGYNVSYCGEELDLVRKNEYMFGREKSEPYDWIGFDNGDLSRLGAFSCPLSEEKILEGPRIASPYSSDPFFQEGSTSLGGGGYIDVTVYSYIDGDTTKFYYPDILHSAGFRDGTSVRYENIDTPEIDHGGASPADPWGDAAKDFTNSLLRKAKRIRLQSLPGASITETYGRLLLYVWASEEESGDDSFYLVNHAIVLNGYSNVAFSGSTSSKMLYRGVSYYQYMVDAQNKAKKEGLRIHGQTDPNYNY